MPQTLDLPIIVVNVNGDREMDPNRRPPILRDWVAAHVAFKAKLIQHAAAAIVLVEQPGFNLKLTGLFTSLASALIAWLQVKQHKEIAQSYSVAELELDFIQEQAQYVTTDRELSNFVGDAENAVSREHTLWTARRDRS